MHVKQQPCVDKNHVQINVKGMHKCHLANKYTLTKLMHCTNIES